MQYAVQLGPGCGVSGNRSRTFAAEHHSRGGKESGLAEQRDAAGAMMDDAAVSGGWGLMTR